jgi:hypothetical protein
MRVKSREDWMAEKDALTAGLREFADVLRRKPFQNSEGLRGVSAFALYWFVRQVRPTVVFEVGVWKGFSTWLIEQAAPDAEIYCFDPLFYLEHLIEPARLGPVYRSPRARYQRGEFSCADLAPVVAAHARPMAFFDDHQHKMPRVRQARAFGLRDLVCDDNTPYPSTHRSFELDRADPAAAAVLAREIERYEVFPALWDTDAVIGGQRIKEDGLGFPTDGEFGEVYAERQWHSYVTYVRLTPDGRPNES